MSVHFAAVPAPFVQVMPVPPAAVTTGAVVCEEVSFDPKAAPAIVTFPPNEIMPSVMLSIVSPFKSVMDVVVAPPKSVASPVIVVAGVIVRDCAPVDVLNTIKSPAESIIDNASAKLVGIVNIFTPVTPSKVIVLPVKLSENVDAHRVPVTPKLSVESVSETRLDPEVIPPVVVNKPVIVVAGVIVTAPVETEPIPIVPEPKALIVRLVFPLVSVTTNATVPFSAAPVTLKPAVCEPVEESTENAGVVAPRRPTAREEAPADVTVKALDTAVIAGLNVPLTVRSPGKVVVIPDLPIVIEVAVVVPILSAPPVATSNP